MRHVLLNALGKIASETPTAAIEIIGAKGATYYGIGAVLVRICPNDPAR
jgi:malate/lactate dehydrogenase